jgi:exopolyphosphatase / guanosine-5'-triphosphate,3'-diphosphate pyrophosphatase
VWEHRPVEPGARLREDDRPFAVIDVGSNSARMIVFRSRPDEHLDVLEDSRAALRLGREVGEHGALGEDAIERALDTLRDFRAIASGAGAERLIAVATSAVREASDGEVFVEGARDLGIPLQVIDGDLEARFGFLGAVHDLPVVHGATMDVGGGSMELTTFHDRHPGRTWTLPLGSLRVSDGFLSSDPPTDRELKDLRKTVTSTLEDADVPRLGDAADLVGIGGTVRNLAKMDLRRTDHPLPLLHGYELLDERLERILDDLASRPLKRRARLRGLNPDRADTIVGGAVVVLNVMHHLRTPRLVVSSRGLREGLALGETEDVPAPKHVRTISVATLSARFATWDARAGARRSSIAGQLFGSLDPDAPPTVAEMLEHAATLLDVGKAIDHYERFEHSAMIVTTADLAGFTHRALGILSAILRDAGGDTSMGPFARLIPREERPDARRAAVALALAEEIHRRIPPGEPAAIRCSWDDGFVVEAPIPATPQLRNVANRFRSVFGSKLAIRPARAGRPMQSVMAPD